MKMIILSLGLILSFSSQAFSTCRNATNTVIYKTAQNFQQLQAAQLVDGRAVLQNIKLEDHQVKLFDRFLIDTEVRGQNTIVTSSVKIQVTKNNGEAFPKNFLNLSADKMALETTYICETIEQIIAE